MRDQQKVDRAMRRGLVAVVEQLLGEPPKHLYDYGMQPQWKVRAYQWLADQKRPKAIYPIHCWSAGYGGPQSPMTWFACKTCGGRELGQPHALPDRPCFTCRIGGREPEGWEVANPTAALTSTLKAAEGMPSHSLAKVLDGPR